MRWLVPLVLVGCGGRADEPSCKAMADHVVKLLGNDAEARMLQQSFEQRCTEDRWSTGMRECVLRTTSTASSQNCKIYLSETQQQRWSDEVSRVTSSAQLPVSCATYQEMVTKAQACEALPREVRGELASRLAEQQAAWAKLADKASLAGQCSSAIQALRSAADACFK